VEEQKRYGASMGHKYKGPSLNPQPTTAVEDYIQPEVLSGIGSDVKTLPDGAELQRKSRRKTTTPTQNELSIGENKKYDDQE